ncbi:hypothetical protein RUM43_001059 [Polyplax serrata]|uniref:Uncharacterized protein n=1 Tax=Polyplax serrata TaxID=468196 RepID=A0AAN8XRF8_POLSC
MSDVAVLTAGKESTRVIFSGSGKATELSKVKFKGPSHTLWKHCTTPPPKVININFRFRSPPTAADKEANENGSTENKRTNPNERSINHAKTVMT